MTTFIGGAGLGLYDSSLWTTGGLGARTGVGSGVGGVYINAVTGNVVLSGRDEQVMGVGLDVAAVRTYNSQGQLQGLMGDAWRLNFERRLEDLPVGNGNGSITRVTADGHRAQYDHDNGRWIGTDGAGAYNTLEAVSGQWIWRDGDSQALEIYDASGRLIEARDSSGNVVTYSWSGGDLIAVTDASGQITHLDYAAGQLVAIRVESDGSDQTRVYYGYDGQGRLAQVTVDLSPADNDISDGQVFITQYGYDGNSQRLTSVTQSDGAQLSIVYQLIDGEHRVVSLTDGEGRTTTLSHDVANRRTDVTGPQGQTQRYLYDTQGRVTQIREHQLSGGYGDTHFTYDSDGNLTRVTDALGGEQHYQYDELGRLLQSMDAAGQVTDYVWDAGNQLISRTEWREADIGAGPGDAQTTRMVYDAQHRLRFELDAAGRVIEHRYDGQGQRSATLRYSAAAYDISGLGSAQVPSLSTLQNWAAQQDGTRLQRADYAYDFRGQLSQHTLWSATDGSGVGVANGEESVTHYVYNAQGQLLQTVAARAASESGSFATSYVYDGLGRLLSSTDSLGRVTTTVYDDAQNRIITTSAHGLVTTTVTNSAGQVIAELYSDGQALGSIEYAYDDSGRLRRVTDPTGAQLHYLYDARGRQVAEIDATGRLRENLYDDQGRLAGQIEYAQAVSAALNTGSGEPAELSLAQVRPSAHADDRRSFHYYDAAHREIYRIDGAGHVTQRMYDAQGRLTDFVAYARAISTAGLDADSPLTTIAGRIQTDAGDRHSRQFHGAAGELIAELDAAGGLREYRYDAAGQLIEQIAYATAVDPLLHASAELADLRPTADANDQHHHLLYDGQGRLVAEVDAEGHLTEHRYDENGNRIERVRYRETVTYSGQPLAALRPTAPQAPHIERWTYDRLDREIGHEDIHGTQTETEWNLQGQVARVTRNAGEPDARSQALYYDALGRLTGLLTGRGSQVLDAAPTQLESVLEQWGTRHEYDAAGRRTATIEAGGARTLYYYDAAGRQTHTINAEGEVREIQYSVLGQAALQLDYATRLTPGQRATLSGGLDDGTLAALLAPLATDANNRLVTFAHDARGLLIGQTDGRGFATELAYNAWGEVKATQQATGALGAGSRHDEHVYDAAGRLIETRRDVGGVEQTTATIWDVFGRAIEYTDANGGISHLRYDRLGRQIETLDPTGGQTLSHWDAFGRQLSLTDALGRETTWTYDDVARTVTISRADSSEEQLDYDAHGQLIASTDGNGLTTHYAYDADGQRVRVTDPAGIVSETVFDARGRIVAIVRDTANLRIGSLFSYDEAGRQILQHEGVQFTLHEGNWQASQVTRSTAYVYDAQGRRIQEVIDPTGLALSTQWTYDADGQVVAKVDANGHTTRYAWDAQGQLIYEVDALGQVTEQQYDALGRSVLQRRYAEPIDALLATDAAAIAQALAPGAGDQVTRAVHDAEGRQRYGVDALGQVVEYRYDANGRMIERIAYGQAIDPQTLPAHASLDDVEQALYGQRLFEQSFGRGHAGLNLANQPHAVYVQDGALHLVNGEHTQNQDVSANGTTYRSLGAGPVAMRVEVTLDELAAGRNLRIGYDNHRGTAAEGNRRTLMAFFNGQNVSVYRIGSGGSATTQLGALENGATYIVEVLVTTDAATLYVYKKGEARDSGYQYTQNEDWDRARVRMFARRSVGRATNINRIERVEEFRGQPAEQLDVRRSHTVYDAAGQARFQIDALGYVVEQRYDAQGRVVSEIAYADAVDVRAHARLTESLLEGHLPATPGAQDRVTEYRYDAAGRLVEVEDAEGLIEAYGYDAAGNRISHTNQNGHTWTYEYDGAGRLVRETTPEVRITTVHNPENPQAVQMVAGIVTEISYDRLGNVVARAEAVGTAQQRVTQYLYDAVGRQVQVIHPQVGVYDVSLEELEPPEEPPSPVLFASDFGDPNSQDWEFLNTSHPVLVQSGLIGWRHNYGQLHLTGASYQYLNLEAGAELIGTRSYSTDQRLVIRTEIEAELYYHTATSFVFGAESIETNSIQGITFQQGYLQTGAGGLGYLEEGGRYLLELEIDPIAGEVVYRYWEKGQDPSTGQELRESLTLSGHIRSTIKVNVDSSVQYPVWPYDFITVGFVVESSEPLDPDWTLGAEAEPEAPDFPVGSSRWARRAEALQAPTSFTLYDALGNGIVGRDIGGHYSYKAYDAAGRLRYEVDAEGYVIGYQYDAFGNRTQLTRYADPLDFTGHSEGAPLGLQDIENRLTASAQDRSIDYTYDRLGRVSEIRQPEVWAYHSGHSTGFTARPTTQYTYNAHGDVIRESVLDDPGTDHWLHQTYYYNQRGERVAHIDAGGYLTQWQHDANGHVTRQLEWRDRLGANDYDSTDFIAPVYTAPDYQNPTHDVAYRETRYDYDGLGRLITETRVGVTHSIFNSAGNLRSVVADLSTEMAYDGVGNTLLLRDAGGAETRLGYDALGRQVSELGPGRKLSAFDTESTYALVTYHYDALGNQVSQTRHAMGGYRDELGNIRFKAPSNSPEGSQDPSSPEFRAPGGLIFHDEFNSLDAGSWETVHAGHNNSLWQINSEGLSLFSFGAQYISSDLLGKRQYNRSNNPSFRVELTLREVFPGHGGAPGLVTYLGATDDLDNLDEMVTIYHNGSVLVNGEYLGVLDFEVPYFLQLDYSGDQVTYTLWKKGADPIIDSSQITESQTGNGDLNFALRNVHESAMARFMEVFIIHGVSEYLEEDPVYTDRPAEHADDQTDYTFYDALGRVTAEVDASGALSEYSYDAWGRMTKSWQAVTRADDSTWHQVQLYQYDAMGRQTAATSVQIDGALISQQVRYNAFGEIVERGTGTIGAYGDELATQHFNERIEYDRNGRMWRSNSNGGVNTVHLHDLHGRATAEIVSATLNLAGSRYQTAEDIADLDTDVRRTEMVYDARHNIVAHRLPGFAQDIGVELRPVFSLSSYYDPNSSLMTWENTAPMGAEVTLRLRKVGSSQWLTPTVSRMSRDEYMGLRFQSGLAIDIDGFDEGRYEYELEYSWPGASEPLALGAGLIHLHGNGTVRVGTTEATFAFTTYNGHPALRITPAAGHDLSEVEAIELFDMAGRGASLLVPVRHDNGSLLVERTDLLPTSATDFMFGTNWGGPLRFRLVGSGSEQVHSLENPGGYHPGIGSPGRLVFLHLMQGAVIIDDIPLDIARADFLYRLAGSESEYHSASIHSTATNACDMMMGYVHTDDATALNALPQQYEFIAKFYDSNGIPIDLSSFAAHGGDEFGTLAGTYDGRFGIVVDYNAVNLARRSFSPQPTYELDRWGQLTGETDARGNLTQYVYDARGNQVAHIGAEAEVVDEQGVVTLASPEHRYFYDARGLLIAETDTNGNTEKYHYDVTGRLLLAENGEGALTHYLYDALGRQVRRIDALGHSVLYGYDHSNRLVSQSTFARTMAFGYDELGHRISDDGIHYDYDARGNVVRSTSRTGIRTWYDYDLHGRRIRETNGNRHSQEWLFNADGRLLSSKDLRGLVTTYTYNYAGQTVREARQHYYDGIYPNSSTGAPNVVTTLGMAFKDYEYYENGQLKTQTDSGGIFNSSAMTFLLFGRGKTEYWYHADGSLARERYSSGLGQGNFSNQHTAFGVDWELIHRGMGSFYAPYVLQDTQFEYDSHNRLVEARGLTSTVQYQYDAAGNRRSTDARYLDADGQERRLFYSYRYDANHRVVAALSAHVTGFQNNSGSFTGLSGQMLQYDGVGNRIVATHYNGPVTATSVNGGHNRLAGLMYSHFAKHNSVTKESHRYLYNADSLLTKVETPTGTMLSQRTYDDWGRVTEYTEGGTAQKEEYTYDADHRLLTQTNSMSGNATSKIRFDYVGNYTGDVTGEDWARLMNGNIALDDLPSYDAAGNLVRYTVEQLGVQHITTTYRYRYELSDSYREVQQTASQTVHYGPPPKGPYHTYTEYDAWGNVALVKGHFAVGGARGFLSNHNGQIVMQYREEDQQVQMYHYAGNRPLGSHTGYLDADFDYNYSGIASGQLHKGEIRPTMSLQQLKVEYAWATQQHILYGSGRDIQPRKDRFDRAMDQWNRASANNAALSSGYPAFSSSSYTVQSGDTLQAIAQRLWGDDSLWYLIADANGIRSNEDLFAGQRLTIPNQVINARNTSETFRPYNSEEIIGSRSPKAPQAPDLPPLPPPPPPPKKKCGGLLQAIVIVVSLVAAIFVPAVLGLTAKMMAGNLLAGIAAGAIGAAAGSVAGQLAGMATGLQSSFSWSAVGKAALQGGLTAGLTQGLGSMLNVGSLPTMGGFNFAEMARAALGSAVNQGVGLALGLQEDFSWASVAAAGMVGGYAGGRTGDGKLDAAAGAAAKQTGGFTQQFTGGLARGFSNRLITVALEGRGRIEPLNIVADAFGTALGNSMAKPFVDAGLKREAERQRIREMEANIPKMVEDSMRGVRENIDTQLGGVSDHGGVSHINGAAPGATNLFEMNDTKRLLLDDQDVDVYVTAGKGVNPSSVDMYRSIGDPKVDVVSTPEMDDLAVSTLNKMPKNRTRNSENVGYIAPGEDGSIYASEPVNIKIKSAGGVGSATFSVPEDAVALYHDHFQGSYPGPGPGDAMSVYRGRVNYIKDERGNIYKIEFSSSWREVNDGNGWRLTTLQGRDLQGQDRWVPGYVASRYN